MGGNFGNKNQNQDADLIAAMLAKEAGAPVKLELSRKEDFIGVHGRWPTAQYYKVGVSKRRHAAGDSAARLQRHGPVPQEHRQHRRHRALSVPEHRERRSIPVYTNKTVSGNFRGPEFPQGFFGIQSMMDDVAYKLKMDPVEFVLKNMTRKSRDEVAVHELHARRVHPPRRRGLRLEETLAAAAGIRPRSDQARRRHVVHGVPLRRSGRSSAVIRLDAKGKYTVFVGVTDVGAGAKTTMGMIAAEALGVPLSQVEVVWGDTDRCPYSVGESGSRTTIMTGYAVIEAAQRSQEADRREGNADGRRTSWSRSASPNPTLEGKVRSSIRRALRRGRSRHRTRPRARDSSTSPCTTADAS